VPKKKLLETSVGRNEEEEEGEQIALAPDTPLLLLPLFTTLDTTHCSFQSNASVESRSV